MHLSISDWIGAAGVTILLFAYLLNLLNKISKESLAYINMNIIGAGLACAASILIDYLPFVILEGVWMLVSAIALIKYFRRI